MNVFRVAKEELEDIVAKEMRDVTTPSEKATSDTELLEDVEEGHPIAIENTTLLGYLGKLMPESVFSLDTATRMIPFVLYVALLGMFYIAGQHYVAKNIRKAEALNKEVQELSWDYKTLKADFMLKSTLSNVAKKVDSIGLKEATEEPYILNISEDK